MHSAYIFLSIITYLLDILLAYGVGCLYVILCIFCCHYSGASFAPWLLHTWVVAVVEDKWATLLASVRLPVGKNDPQAALLRWKAQRVTSEGDADTPTHLSVPLFSSFTLKCPAHWCQREGGNRWTAGAKQKRSSCTTSPTDQPVPSYTNNIIMHQLRQVTPCWRQRKWSPLTARACQHH